MHFLAADPLIEPPFAAIARSCEDVLQASVVTRTDIGGRVGFVTHAEGLMQCR